MDLKQSNPWWFYTSLAAITLLAAALFHFAFGLKLDIIVFVGFVVVIGGVILYHLVHEYLGTTRKEEKQRVADKAGISTSERRGKQTVLICPKCRQQLRVPTNKGDLVLHCPKCRHSWDWSHAPAPEEKSAESQPEQELEQLLQRLRAIVLGNEQIMERLIEAERSKAPEIGRLNWVRLAIERWERDNR